MSKLLFRTIICQPNKTPNTRDLNEDLNIKTKRKNLHWYHIRSTVKKNFQTNTTTSCTCKVPLRTLSIGISAGSLTLLHVESNGPETPEILT